MASKDNAPRQDNACLPVPGGGPLQHQVARDLENDVADEVYRLHPIVLIRCHFQLFQDVTTLADLEDLDICGIGVIDCEHREVYSAYWQTREVKTLVRVMPYCS